MYRSIEINIMNIFNQLQSYAGKYTLKSKRSFSDEEKSAVSRAETVTSEFGISVCFFMRNGSQKYIPMSTTTSIEAGETLDINKISILVLTKENGSDILRVEYPNI